MQGRSQESENRGAKIAQSAHLCTLAVGGKNLREARKKFGGSHAHYL